MDFFEDCGFDDIIDDASCDIDFEIEPIDNDEDLIDDDCFCQDCDIENNGYDISFKGHLEDIYNPEIQRAQDNYDLHMSKLVDSSDLSDMKYHLEKAEQAKGNERFFQACLEEARRQQKIDDARLESILGPLEIEEKYRKEIEDIYNQTKHNKK